MDEVIDEIPEDEIDTKFLLLKLMIAITLVSSSILILFVVFQAFEVVNASYSSDEKQFEYVAMSILAIFSITRFIGGVYLWKRNKLGFYIHATANILIGVSILVSLIAIRSEFDSLSQMMEEDGAIFLMMILFSLSCFLFVHLYYRQSKHFQK